MAPWTVAYFPWPSVQLQYNPDKLSVSFSNNPGLAQNTLAVLFSIQNVYSSLPKAALKKIIIILPKKFTKTYLKKN